MPNKIFQTVTIAAVLSTSLSARAELALSDFWVRAMPPTQHMTAGYGEVRNVGESPVVISGGRTSFSDAIELHESVRDGDSVRMIPIREITLGPGDTLTLTPGGAHLMITGVKRMPTPGTTVTICLQFDGDEAVCTEAPVLRNAPDRGMEHHDSHSHHDMQH